MRRRPGLQICGVVSLMLNVLVLAIGMLFVASVADFFAFFVWQSVFDYSFRTAWLALAGCLGFLMVGIALIPSNGVSIESKRTQAQRIRRIASKWTWRMFWGANVGVVLLGCTASLFPATTQHHVEVIGEWDAIRFTPGRGDSHMVPDHKPSPILRDIMSGEVFAVSDPEGESNASEILHSGGLKSRQAVVVFSDLKPMQQARVKLESSWFGKHRIVEVIYEDFEALPLKVQQSVVVRLQQEKARYAASLARSAAQLRSKEIEE
jgi:hypothetical protein